LYHEQAEERRLKREGKREFELAKQRLEIEKLRVEAEAKLSETFQQVPNVSESSPQLPRDWRKLKPEHKQLVIELNDVALIMQRFNVSDRTAETWLKNLSGDRDSLVHSQTT